MRLVDADALKAEWYRLNDINEEDCGARFVGYQEIARLINNAPTVQPTGDLISRADAIETECRIRCGDKSKGCPAHSCPAIEEFEALPSAESVPQSEQYKKGFEDAKRAFLVEYARESENMRKRNAELEVMLNAQRAISADAVQGEWIEVVRCKDCKHFELDHFNRIDGIPIITAHEICTKWSSGCKTSKDGFCFMGERKKT